MWYIIALMGTVMVVCLVNVAKSHHRFRLAMADHRLARAAAESDHGSYTKSVKAGRAHGEVANAYTRRLIWIGLLLASGLGFLLSLVYQLALHL